MRATAAVETAIAAATGADFKIASSSALGGGCINQAWAIEGNSRRYFVKTNRAELAEMFEAEADGLRELESAEALRVPHPVACGASKGEAFLVLEYIHMDGGGDPARMGQALALQHRKTAGRFGWLRDNTIGSTPQHNPWTTTWIDFFREQRLGFQLHLAEKNELGTKISGLGNKLLDGLEGFFPGYHPLPSLLHGDLWGGNVAFSNSGEPVVFDPAVYYGDREADIAMTELFGGFAPGFYAAYSETWPLETGYKTRKTLYNLYHILNHANLFGGSYIGQAESMMSRLLSEVK